MTDEQQLPGPLPRATATLGLMLAACAVLPLMPDGRSFFDLVREAFAVGPLQGVLFLTGFGSPFLFGLTVVAARWLQPKTSVPLVRLPVMMMHSQLVLAGWTLRDEAIAALPLLGFAVVSMLALTVRSASVRAGSDMPSPVWLVRWGAAVVCTTAMWCRLQMFGGLRLGLAVDAAWLVSAVLILATRRR